MQKLTSVLDFLMTVGGNLRRRQWGAIGAHALRIAIWALIFSVFALDGFYAYIAFGGRRDFGAIVSGFIVVSVTALYVTQGKEMWTLVRRLRIPALGAVFFATLLVSFGFLQHSWPGFDWLHTQYAVVFVPTILAVFILNVVLLPKLFQALERRGHALHQSIARFILRITYAPLFIVAVLMTLGFAAYFTFSLVGSASAGAAQIVLGSAGVAVGTVGVIMFGIYWDRIRFQRKFAPDVVALPLFFIALILVDAGIWTTLFSSPNSPSVVLGSDRFVSITILGFVDSTLMFGIPCLVATVVDIYGAFFNRGSGSAQSAEFNDSVGDVDDADDVSEFPEN